MIERIGQDRYERTLAVVYADGVNVSCAMVQEGYAAYVRRWDNGGRVARDC
jgi:endonuclease YncB( thermonuclease family)